MKPRVSTSNESIYYLFGLVINLVVMLESNDFVALWSVMISKTAALYLLSDVILFDKKDCVKENKCFNKPICLCHWFGVE